MNIGIAGIGIYLPEKTVDAKEVSNWTKGQWSEDAVLNKLGIAKKYMPSDEDGTQEMGAKSALAAIENAGIDPKEIDLVLYYGEEWKEYPLTTSACYVQDRVGAVNAWSVDVQNRCCTGITALKIAKDMMVADEDINTVLVAGGYRNCDFINYEDSTASMMFDLGAGGGSVVLKKGINKNLLLGSHLISDGSLAHTAGVKYGGTKYPIDKNNLDRAYKSLMLMEPKKMKDRLNEVSLPNWYKCIDKSLEKSGYSREHIDFLAVLHMKRSGHLEILKELGLREDQSIYLENYGHIGQVDQILSLKLALDEGKVKDGDVVCMLAAGIGYVWAANIIKWG